MPRRWPGQIVIFQRGGPNKPSRLWYTGRTATSILDKDGLVFPRENADGGFDQVFHVVPEKFCVRPGRDPQSAADWLGINSHERVLNFVMVVRGPSLEDCDIGSFVLRREDPRQPWTCDPATFLPGPRFSI